MFHSPVEMEKRLSDEIEIFHNTLGYSTICLEKILNEIIEDDNNLVQDIELNDNLDYEDSLVTVKDFDLKLPVDSQNTIPIHNEKIFGTFGFNLDKYLNKLPNSNSKLYKGLLMVTKDFKTNSAALIQNKVLAHIGIENRVVDRILYQIKNKGFEDLSDKKRIYIVNKSDKALYKELFYGEKEQFEFIILPCKYNQIKESYLILFFNVVNSTIIELINNLKNK
jgi:hypothetical protein